MKHFKYHFYSLFHGVILSSHSFALSVSFNYCLADKLQRERKILELDARLFIQIQRLYTFLSFQKDCFADNYLKDRTQCSLRDDDKFSPIIGK